jgi:hypothetical protein
MTIMFKIMRNVILYSTIHLWAQNVPDGAMGFEHYRLPDTNLRLQYSRRTITGEHPLFSSLKRDLSLHKVSDPHSDNK